jgi:hypothetical protein
MIDGEGTVSDRGYVRIGNTEEDILTGVEQACSVLGITTVRYSNGIPKNPQWKPAQVVAIQGKENIQKLLDLPLRSQRKFDAIKRRIDAYRPERPTRQELYTRYIVYKHSASRIAQEENVCAATVVKWIAKYGLMKKNYAKCGPSETGAKLA